MTNEEYLAIVDNPNKTITIKELFYALHSIKIDAEQDLEYDRNNTLEQQRWLCGLINGLDIAINLIEHLERK